MGMPDPQISSLESFFSGMGRLSFLVAIANVHSLSSWLAPGSLSFWLTLALSFLTCENGHFEWRDLICPCSFDFHPPVMIRDVENLILLQSESIFSLYSFP